LVVTVILRIESLSAPGWADMPPQNLTPASRRQDHTTSPFASAPFVNAPLSLTGLIPPCDNDCAPTLPRPSHPKPNVRDDRETPLCGPGRRGYGFDLGETERDIFLRLGLDDPNQVDAEREFSFYAQRRTLPLLPSASMPRCAAGGARSGAECGTGLARVAGLEDFASAARTLVVVRRFARGACGARPRLCQPSATCQ